MEEGGWGDNKLTVSPWGTQESGARGIWVGAQADESNGQKSPSVKANDAGMQGRHGAWQEQS